MFTAKHLQDKIEDYISGLPIVKSPERLYQPIDYILSIGGKRIRPVLMLMAYNLYKDDVDKIYGSAAGIEIFHNYTLLHDDLMDRSDMRRGKPTVHKVWNDNTAILSGDAMFVLAYKYMATCVPEYLKDVMTIFTATAQEICEGQQYDVDFEERTDVTEQEYLEMIRLKTAVLLAASLNIGALQAGASDDDSDLLYNFGINLGLAFQLKDDYLDVYGNPTIFGKKIGGDIFCNKKTFMLIKALEYANATQTQDLKHWMNFSDDVDREEKIKAVVSIYEQIGIKTICENKMNEYYENAMQCLDRVSVCDDNKEQLRSLAQQLMHRQI